MHSDKPLLSERVGITGYSQGTEQVACDLGPYNKKRDCRHRVKERFATWGLGDWPDGETNVRWKQLAPDLNANHNRAPLLNNDPDSEVITDLSLYTSLKELRKPVELFIYPNEGHTINQPKHRLQIYERNVDWFRFWLKGEEDPDPSKTQQYVRWRELRKQQEENGNKALPRE